MKKREIVPRNSRYPAVLSYIAGRLRYLRITAMKISLTEAGTQLGVSYQQIQKYERGQNRITADVLFFYAEANCIPIESFFPPQEDSILTDRILKSAIVIATLTPLQQETLLIIMKSMKNRESLKEILQKRNNAFLLDNILNGVLL